TADADHQFDRYAEQETQEGSTHLGNETLRDEIDRHDDRHDDRHSNRHSDRNESRHDEQSPRSPVEIPVLRFYYYTSLPCSDGSDVTAKLGEQHTAAIVRARNHVRQRVARGGLSVVQMNWLILLLEVTRSSPTIDKDIIEYYGSILPGFALLLPDSLKIKLPEGCPRARHLEHISRFVSW
ncbi:hypothetical protein GE061_018132, partial [Apolygus lucorum]